jgi:hypothetical protein
MRSPVSRHRNKGTMSMFTDLTTFLSVLSVVLTICVAIGGFFALRHGYSQTTTDVQAKVIDALKAQNESQELQIATCEKEIARLKRVVATIQLALKRRGLQIEISGDEITIVDKQGNRTHTVQIKMADDADDKQQGQETG